MKVIKEIDVQETGIECPICNKMICVGDILNTVPKRMLAAAPELLEACKEAQKTLVMRLGLDLDGTANGLQCAAWVSLENAIAKATA